MFLRFFFVVNIVVGILAAKDLDSSGCGSPKYQTGEQGNFSNKNYLNPNSYEGISECSWWIKVPASKKIKLTFNEKFDLLKLSECINNVKVYSFSKSDRSRTLIGEYCGKYPPSPIYVEENEAFVRFQSYMGSDQKFSIQWSAVESVESESSGCGSPKYQTGEQGNISSINYPNTYNGSFDCSWLITVPASKRIKLTFNRTFGLKKNKNRCYDNIKVYDIYTSGNKIEIANVRGSRRINGELIGEYCGNVAPPDPIYIHDNTAFIWFQSYSSIDNKGFNIQWSTVANVDIGVESTGENRDSGCNSQTFQLGNEGTFSSMNYPNLYKNFANCSWLIHVPRNQYITLRFDEAFELEKGMESGRCYDFVKVYRGSNSNGDELGLYCGEEAPNSILVTSSKAFVVFQSDEAIPLKGFKIRWSATASRYE